MANVIEFKRKDRDDEPLVMHWNAVCCSWRRVNRDMWSRFWSRKAGLQCLTGDQFFAVCVICGNEGCVNIHPHRYLLDENGRIMSYDFDEDFSEEERKTLESLRKRYYYKSDPSQPDYAGLSETERATFDHLSTRIWRNLLPPREAALALLRDLPNGLTKDPRCPVHDFFRELGVETETEFIIPPQELVEVIAVCSGKWDNPFEAAIEIVMKLGHGGLVIAPRERVFPTTPK
jgi:hypothetical protein